MTIKWQGTNTSKVVKWTLEAESYLELLNKLIEKELAHDYIDFDGNTFQELLNYSEELMRLNAEEDIESLYEFDFEKLLGSLSDEQIRNVIKANDGMAYYQTFTEE